jgi:hypothetical protein
MNPVEAVTGRARARIELCNKQRRSVGSGVVVGEQSMANGELANGELVNW